MLYEVANVSLIVVRLDETTIKAYPNACLHRGRRLKDHDGHCSEMRCSFHSFAWSLDGELKDVPARWDFPHIEEREFHLPELKVATWAGFVFVNPDPQAAPFADFVSGLAGYVRADGGDALAFAIFSGVSGNRRRRFPVATNSALATAGPMSAVAGSPMPPGFSALFTSTMSICGASLMRTTG